MKSEKRKVKNGEKTSFLVSYRRILFSSAKLRNSSHLRKTFFVICAKHPVFGILSTLSRGMSGHTLWGLNDFLVSTQQSTSLLPEIDEPGRQTLRFALSSCKIRTHAREKKKKTWPKGRKYVNLCAKYGKKIKLTLPLITFPPHRSPPSGGPLTV